MAVLETTRTLQRSNADAISHLYRRRVSQRHRVRQIVWLSTSNEHPTDLEEDAMKTRTTCRAVVTAVMIVFSVACGGSGSPTSPTAPSPARDYSGSWRATTSQGNTLTFQVSGNAVSEFLLTVSYTGRFSNNIGSGTCTATFTYRKGITGNALNPPMPITADSFRSPAADNDGIVGTFTSATSASGTASFPSGTQGANTGGCISTAATNITWTANKG